MYALPLKVTELLPLVPLTSLTKTEKLLEAVTDIELAITNDTRLNSSTPSADGPNE
jgi:hypothetical protein